MSSPHCRPCKSRLCFKEDHLCCGRCHQVYAELETNWEQDNCVQVSFSFICCRSIDAEYCSTSGKILCHLVPEKEFILTGVSGKPLPDSDETCQPESALNFIPLNSWIRIPPWLLSLGTQLFLIGGLRAEPTKHSISFDLPGLCSLIQTEQCET